MKLIGKIYEALDDDEAYRSLPKLVATAIGSRSCTMQMFSPDFTLEDMWHHYFESEMDDFYWSNNLHLYDEWAKTMKASGANKTNRHTDFLPIDEFCKSFFYNEFMRRFGDDTCYCLGFGSTRPDGGLVVMGLHKGYSQEDFTRQQIAQLEAIRPHITRMAVLRGNLAREKEQAVGANLGINAIRDAYLLVRADRKILFANASAEVLLDGGELLKLYRGQIYLSRLVDDKRLYRCLAEAKANRVDGRLSFQAADRLGQRWRFTIAPKLHNGATLFLIWIDQARSSPTAAKAMQQIYGLTKAELPVLMAVSKGLTAREISDHLQITIATVRSHIQHIYEKTGCNKASQLASLVATLPKV